MSPLKNIVKTETKQLLPAKTKIQTPFDCVKIEFQMHGQASRGYKRVRKNQELNKQETGKEEVIFYV